MKKYESVFFIPWPPVNFYLNRGDFLLKIRGGPWTRSMDPVHGPGPWSRSMVVHGPSPWGGPWTPVHVLYTSRCSVLLEQLKWSSGCYGSYTWFVSLFCVENYGIEAASCLAFSWVFQNEILMLIGWGWSYGTARKDQRLRYASCGLNLSFLCPAVISV